MQGCGLLAPVVGGDLHQDVVRVGLGVFDIDVEIAVIVEHASVGQFEFRHLPGPAPVLLRQAFVRKRTLRIFVKHLQVGVGRGGVQVVVEFLHILAVVGFAVGEPEQPFLEDRVLSVPQHQGQAQVLVLVADAGNAIFAPAISAATRLFVAEIIRDKRGYAPLCG